MELVIVIFVFSKRFICAKTKFYVYFNKRYLVWYKFDKLSLVHICIKTFAEGVRYNKTVLYSLLI